MGKVLELIEDSYAYCLMLNAGLDWYFYFLVRNKEKNFYPPILDWV